MLLTCPECGKSFSHTAGACPACSWTFSNDPDFFLLLARHYLLEQGDIRSAFELVWKALTINSEHQGALSMAYLILTLHGDNSSKVANAREDLLNKLYSLNPDLANQLVSDVKQLYQEPSLGEKIWKSLFG